MWMRLASFACLSALFMVPPVNAQFGVAGNRRQQQGGGTKFQDLQQRAQQQQQEGPGAQLGAAGGVDQLHQLLGDAFKDPEMLKQYEAAMEELSKMTPEQLQQQMMDAMKMLSQGDMLNEVLKNKDAVIKNLEVTGAVSAEEIARYKTDDAYFELKMRESFKEMEEVFTNPDYMKLATDAMQNVAELLKDPNKVFESLSSVFADMTDDQIEEARLKLLAGGFEDDPLISSAFATDEMKDIAKDPVKWKSAVQDGYENLKKQAKGKDAKDEL